MKCKYCGQDAGFFSRSHKECEEKHNRGIQGMTDLMLRYFSGAISAKDFSQKLDKNTLPYFLTDSFSIITVWITEREPLWDELERLVVQKNTVITSLIQRSFRNGYYRINSTMDQLKAASIVGKAQGVSSRAILLDDPTLYKFLNL